MQRMRQIQFLFGNGDQHVSGNGAPNLRLERVLAGAKETLDMQMLFDPFEEQLHTPTALVQSANRRCGKRHIVGQKHQGFARFGVGIADAAQVRGVALAGQHPRQQHPLVGADSRVGRKRMTLNNTALQIAFGTGHKVGFGALQHIQSLVIDIGFVHHVERAGFDKSLIYKDIEHLHIVHLAVADVNKAGDRAAQIQQGVQFDGRFGGAKRCPGKQRQTQVDGGGVQRIDRGFEFAQQRAIEFVARVQHSGRANQVLGQFGKDLPGTRGIGVGQGVARDTLAAQAHVIPLRTLLAQIELDAAQRIAPCELCVGHDIELIQTGKIFGFVLSTVRGNDARERLDGKFAHELREDELTRKHVHPWLKTALEHARLCKNDLYRGQTQMVISSNNSSTYGQSA